MREFLKAAEESLKTPTQKPQQPVVTKPPVDQPEQIADDKLVRIAQDFYKSAGKQMTEQKAQEVANFYKGDYERMLKDLYKSAGKTLTPERVKSVKEHYKLVEDVPNTELPKEVLDYNSQIDKLDENISTFESYSGSLGADSPRMGSPAGFEEAKSESIQQFNQEKEQLTDSFDFKPITLKEVVNSLGKNKDDIDEVAQTSKLYLEKYTGRMSESLDRYEKTLPKNVQRVIGQVKNGEAEVDANDFTDSDVELYNTWKQRYDVLSKQKDINNSTIYKRNDFRREYNNVAREAKDRGESVRNAILAKAKELGDNAQWIKTLETKGENADLNTWASTSGYNTMKRVVNTLQDTWRGVKEAFDGWDEKSTTYNESFMKDFEKYLDNEVAEDIERLMFGVNKSKYDGDIHEKRVDVNGVKLILDGEGEAVGIRRKNGDMAFSFTEDEVNALKEYEANKEELKKGAYDDLRMGTLGAKATQVATDMIPIIAATVGTGGPGGTALGTYLVTYGDYYDQQFAKTGSVGNATAFASVATSLQAMLEGLGGIEGSIIKNASKKAVNQAVVDAAEEVAVKNVVNGKTAMSAFMKHLGKQMLEETGIEISQSLSDAYTEILFNGETDLSWKELEEVVLLTPFATAPIAGAMSANSFKNFSMENLKIAAKKKDLFNKLVDEWVGAAKTPEQKAQRQEEADFKKGVVEELSQSLVAVDELGIVDPNVSKKILDKSVEIVEKKKQIKNAKSDQAKGVYENELSKLQSEVQELVQKGYDKKSTLDELIDRAEKEMAERDARLKTKEKESNKLNSNRTENDFENSKESYRIIVGDEAFNDIVESGVVRTNSKNKGKKSGGIDLSGRPTLYPSFSRGKASMEYAANNPNHYIIVTEDPSIQPSKVGRHGKGTTMFPTDENGNHLQELSGEKVKVYKHMGNGKYSLVYANGKLIQDVKEFIPLHIVEDDPEFQRLNIVPDNDKTKVRPHNLPTAADFEAIYDEGVDESEIGGEPTTDIEAKIVGIERRRQEELNERVVYDRKPTVKDGEFRIVGDPNKQVYRINEFTGRLQVKDNETGLWTVEGTHGKIELETAQRSGFEKVKENINAKYDAEIDEELSKLGSGKLTLKVAPLPTEFNDQGEITTDAVVVDADGKTKAQFIVYGDTPVVGAIEVDAMVDEDLQGQGIGTKAYQAIANKSGKPIIPASINRDYRGEKSSSTLSKASALFWKASLDNGTAEEVEVTTREGKVIRTVAILPEGFVSTPTIKKIEDTGVEDFNVESEAFEQKDEVEVDMEKGTFVLNRRGVPVTYKILEYKKNKEGEIVSIKVEDPTGKKKTIRAKEVVAEIVREKIIHENKLIENEITEEELLRATAESGARTSEQLSSERTDQDIESDRKEQEFREGTREDILKQSVNYQGVQGKLYKEEDGSYYVLSTDGEKVFVEGGESTATNEELGITKGKTNVQLVEESIKNAYADRKAIRERLFDLFWDIQGRIPASSVGAFERAFFKGGDNVISVASQLVKALKFPISQPIRNAVGDKRIKEAENLAAELKKLDKTLSNKNLKQLRSDARVLDAKAEAKQLKAERKAKEAAARRIAEVKPPTNREEYIDSLKRIATKITPKQLQDLATIAISQVNALVKNYGFTPEEAWARVKGRITDEYNRLTGNKLSQDSTEKQQIKDQAIADGTFMKAPNGKKTNLTEDQWLTVRTKAFKNWFGDWENDKKIIIRGKDYTEVFTKSGIPFKYLSDLYGKGDFLTKSLRESLLRNINFHISFWEKEQRKRGEKLKGEEASFEFRRKMLDKATQRLEDLRELRQLVEEDVLLPSDVEVSLGDNVSKVVDENGEPLVVYHGTPSKNFEVFEQRESRDGIREYGYYFSTNKKLSEVYGENVRPFFLNIRDMVSFDAKNESNIEAYNNLEVNLGYKTAVGRPAMEALSGKNNMRPEARVDGVKASNIVDMFVGFGKATEEQIKEYSGDSYLVWFDSPENIKSATDNQGTFDPNNPSILHQGENTSEIKDMADLIARLPEGFTIEKDDSFGGYKGYILSYKGDPIIVGSDAKEIEEKIKRNDYDIEDVGKIHLYKTPNSKKIGGQLIGENYYTLTQQANLLRLFGNEETSDVPNLSQLDDILNQGNRGAVNEEFTYFSPNADVSTPIHEDNHRFLKLVDELAAEGNKKAIEDKKKVDDFARSEEGKKFWDRKKKAGKAWAQGKYDPNNYTFRQELFAESAEKYFSEGKRAGFSKEMNELFDRFKSWLQDIYKGLMDSPLKIELSPEIRSLFDSIYGAEKVAEDVSNHNKTKSETKKQNTKESTTKTGTTDVINDTVWDTYNKTGIVPNSVLQSIADHVQNSTIDKMSPRQFTIFNNKIAEVNKILAERDAEGSYSRKTAEKATDDAMSIIDRRNKQIGNVLKSLGYTQDQINSTITVFNQVAKRWAKKNNRPIEDFYSDVFKGIEVADLGEGRRGRTVSIDGGYMIQLMSGANAATPVHELAHIMEKFLNNKEKQDVLDWLGKDKWDRSVSEAFAKGFEQWLMKSEDVPDLDAFKRFKEWLMDIYKGIIVWSGQALPTFTPEVKSLYSNLLKSDIPEHTKKAYSEAVGKNNTMFDRMKKQGIQFKKAVFEDVLSKISGESQGFRRFAYLPRTRKRLAQQAVMAGYTNPVNAVQFAATQMGLMMDNPDYLPSTTAEQLVGYGYALMLMEQSYEAVVAKRKRSPKDQDLLQIQDELSKSIQELGQILSLARSNAGLVLNIGSQSMYRSMYSPEVLTIQTEKRWGRKTTDSEKAEIARQSKYLQADMERLKKALEDANDSNINQIRALAEQLVSQNFENSPLMNEAIKIAKSKTERKRSADLKTEFDKISKMLSEKPDMLLTEDIDSLYDEDSSDAEFFRSMRNFISLLIASNENIDSFEKLAESIQEYWPSLDQDKLLNVIVWSDPAYQKAKGETLASVASIIREESKLLDQLRTYLTESYQDIEKTGNKKIFPERLQKLEKLISQILVLSATDYTIDFETFSEAMNHLESLQSIYAGLALEKVTFESPNLEDMISKVREYESARKLSMRQKQLTNLEGIVKQLNEGTYEGSLSDIVPEKLDRHVDSKLEEISNRIGVNKEVIKSFKEKSNRNEIIKRIGTLLQKNDGGESIRSLDTVYEAIKRELPEVTKEEVYNAILHKADSRVVNERLKEARNIMKKEVNALGKLQNFLKKPLPKSNTPAILDPLQTELNDLISEIEKFVKHRYEDHSDWKIGELSRKLDNIRNNYADVISGGISAMSLEDIVKEVQAIKDQETTEALTRNLYLKRTGTAKTELYVNFNDNIFDLVPELLPKFITEDNKILKRKLSDEIKHERLLRVNRVLDVVKNLISSNDIKKFTDEKGIYHKEIESIRKFLDIEKKSKDVKAELIRINREVYHKRKVFNDWIEEKYLKETTAKVKAFVNTPRLLVLAGDISFVTYQFGVMSVTHPIISAKAFGKMAYSAFSEKKWQNQMADFQLNPFYDVAISSGLKLVDETSLTFEEELQLTSILESWPYVRVPARMLRKFGQRIYSTYANHVRLSTFVEGIKSLDSVQGGYIGKDKNFYEDETKFIAEKRQVLLNLAEDINTHTGSASVFTTGGSFDEGLNNFLNSSAGVLIAPRLYASVIKAQIAMTGVPDFINLYSLRNKPSDDPMKAFYKYRLGENMKRMAGVVGWHLTMLAMFTGIISGLFGGDDDEMEELRQTTLNPYHSQFLKVKSGQRVFSISPFVSYYRYAARVGFQAAINDGAEDLFERSRTMESKTGFIDHTWDFFKFRFNPAIPAFIEAGIMNRDWNGEKISKHSLWSEDFGWALLDRTGAVAKRSLAPIWGQGIIDNINRKTLDQIPGEFLIDFSGINSYTVEPYQSNEVQNFLDDKKFRLSYTRVKIPKSISDPEEIKAKVKMEFGEWLQSEIANGKNPSKEQMQKKNDQLMRQIIIEAR